jgi:hypothetical protein
VWNSGLFAGKGKVFVIYSPKQLDQVWVPHGCLSFFPGVNQVGREADHSLLSSAEVRNECTCTCSSTRQ